MFQAIKRSVRFNMISLRVINLLGIIGAIFLFFLSDVSGTVFGAQWNLVSALFVMIISFITSHALVTVFKTVLYSHASGKVRNREPGFSPGELQDAFRK